MSPINEGDIRITTRNLAQHAVDSIDNAVRSVIDESRKREERARVLTDIAFREWHAENFSHADRWAQEFSARMTYFIPTLTETPVDRLMNRFRGAR